MKHSMKNEEIKEIEDKLSDIEVPDSVLDCARAEMTRIDKPRKSLRLPNNKIALSFAASFVLCLAIILPVSLSFFDGQDSNTPDASEGDDNNDYPMSPSAPSEAPYYELQWLDKEQIYPGTGGNETPPGDTGSQPPEDVDLWITYLLQIKYSDGGLAIISEEKYSVYGATCTVYTLYNTHFKVDILEQFNDFTDQYAVGDIIVNYKTSDEIYLADVTLNEKRLNFTGKFSEKSVFEAFCEYLLR